jgi:hypothetical protein
MLFKKYYNNNSFINYCLLNDVIINLKKKISGKNIKIMLKSEAERRKGLGERLMAKKNHTLTELIELFD